MPRLRSILSLILVLVTTVLVSCGSPQVTVPPPTYTAEKIEQLQTLLKPIETAQEGLSTLENAITKQNWVDVRGYIRGPLGQLRQEMLYLSRNLLPKDQPQATKVAKEFFGHLESIDAAAKDRDYGLAVGQFREAASDFGAFLDLIPKA